MVQRAEETLVADAQEYCQEHLLLRLYDPAMESVSIVAANSWRTARRKRVESSGIPMLWSRKSAPIHDKARHVGIDVTASRVRAVAVGMGKVQPLALDEPAEDLLLFIGLDQRLPEIGRAGFALAARCRTRSFRTSSRP